MKQKSSWLTGDRITQIALFFILLACFSYTFPRWEDPNQNSHIDMIIAVVDRGTFQIDQYVQNTVDFAKVGAHYYSDKAPGLSFLGIPVYAGLRYFLNLPIIDSLMNRLANNAAFVATLRENGSGILKDKVRFAIAQVVLTFVLAALPTALLGLLMFRLSRRFTTNVVTRAGLVLAYGLLTPAFAYAGSFYSHQLSALLLFSAFYIAFTRQAKFSIGALLAVGLLLGYSVLSEYPSIILAGILFFYTLYKLLRQDDWRKIGWVILPAGLIALGLMAYNNAIFGGPFQLGYGFSEDWTVQHHTGFMSLTYPHPAAIWGITFSVFRGLFVLSPWLLLFIPGFVLWWRSRKYRPEFWVALAGILGFFWFNASSIMWWGGFAVGPRYLLPALPFMVLPVVFVFREWGERAWLKGICAASFIWSFIATWGLTLAEQAFPPDTISNPFLDFALPNWRIGNIARNVGTILGMHGVWSLVPLLLLGMLLILAWWVIANPGSSSPAFRPELSHSQLDHS
jgi:hypothetical protein